MPARLPRPAPARPVAAPAADLSQELVDAVFAHLDANLRELGVGDMGVGKRMKKIAAAFYGRAHSYDTALAARPI